MPPGQVSSRGGRRRAPWGSLTRAQVVDAAVAAARAGDLTRLSMRRIAQDLGVAPMSIYRHVRDKDDLLDAVVDRLLSESWRPEAPSAEWDAWVLEAADRLRALLVEQPAALQVYFSHPVVSPTAVARMDEMLTVLGAGFPDAERARGAYAAIHTYTLGFAAFEASRRRFAPSDEGGALARELMAYATPAQFLAGLRCLVIGLRSELVADASSAAHPITT